MSVCLYQREVRFCGIWMKVWVMAPVSILSFFPSGLHLSPSSPHVCTYVSVTVTLLRLQYAYHMIDVCGGASLHYITEHLYQSGCLSTTKIIIIAFLTCYIQKSHKQDASKSSLVFIVVYVFASSSIWECSFRWDKVRANDHPNIHVTMSKRTCLASSFKNGSWLCLTQQFGNNISCCLSFSVSTQPSNTALCWPQTVCKTGSITTRSHSCTSGQSWQTHANAPKCAFMRTHTLAQKHTHTQKFIRFAGMSQQDIRALEDHIWYGTCMVNGPSREQNCICVHCIWPVLDSNATNSAAVFPWQND